MRNCLHTAVLLYKAIRAVDTKTEFDKIMDFSVIKNNPIGEKKNVQFRVEIFNLPNHPNLDLPNRDFDSGLAGRIFSAQASRQIQLGLKIVY